MTLNGENFWDDFRAISDANVNLIYKKYEYINIFKNMVLT